MRASGDFGDNAAIGGVDIDLRNDDVGKNLATVFDDGGGAFVAAGFDTQYVHLFSLAYLDKYCQVW